MLCINVALESGSTEDLWSRTSSQRTLATCLHAASISANTHSSAGFEWPAPARTRTMTRCESSQARTTTTLLVSAVTRAL
ncbi:MAG: hypothetical protein QOD48_1446 [Gaiellaceae bacterium]|jgi:hypothetical protein|nr:hypothetical protein [Gaiellaceae bacterium]